MPLSLHILKLDALAGLRRFLIRCRLFSVSGHPCNYSLATDLNGAGAEGGLIRDSWPGGLGRVPGAHDLDEQDMADWQFVPLTFEAVCDWAVVGSKRAPDSVDRARNKVLLYRNIGQTVGGMRRGVTLRLQGYIKSCNLQPLGDWDRCVQ
jgi:hypothetical protein